MAVASVGTTIAGPLGKGLHRQLVLIKENSRRSEMFPFPRLGGDGAPIDTPFSLPGSGIAMARQLPQTRPAAALAREKNGA